MTAGLSAALRKKGTSSLFDRGIVLASLATAIALGATRMSDIALLAHLAPVLGDAPSGPTVRREAWRMGRHQVAFYSQDAQLKGISPDGDNDGWVRS